MRSKVILGDMTLNEVDEAIQLLRVRCSDRRKEVVEELLLSFQRLYLAIDGDFAALVVLVVLDAFCVM
jgi:hypothetical protein